MKYFDSIMTGQLMPSNALSDDDEPDLQKVLIEEARQRQLNQKSLIKLKQTKLKYKPKFRKISVSHLLKEFNQQHTDSVGHPNPATLLDISGMYILYFYFCSTQLSHC